MPLNKDIKKVLVIGSGPIVIGQAAEFDYAGTQACRALKAEGLEVVLINSNPATIMTDKHMADKIYIEPLTLDVVKRVIEIEKPDSVVITSEPDDMKEFTSATLIIAIAAHPPSVTYSGASSQNTVSTAQIMATAIMLKARFITPPSPPETASVNALPRLDSRSCGDCAVSPTSSSA